MKQNTTYKQTELGLIPEDWEVKKFNKFSKFYSGGTPLTSKSEYYGGEIPFIKSGEIYYDRTEQFLTQEGLNNSSAKLVYRGDLLYALYGANSGEVAISQLEGAINQAILCIQQNKDEAETIYLYNYLKLEKSNIINKFLQGGQGNLSADIIKNLQIPLPPLPEQKKIADCLSTWDVAIEKQSALINALTDRKKALMQQLLTGKKRLPGFSDEWKEVKLGEICEIKKGSQINKIELSSNLGFPVINGGIEPSGYHDDWNVAENTITISEGGNSCGFINFIKEKFWSGGHCYTLQNLKININKIFLFYFLKNSENQIMKLRVGSGLPNIQQKDIKNFEILLPKIEEQTAIAEILTIADRELQLQKDKLAQLQQQKKGLMQVLLTGKKRLLN